MKKHHTDAQTVKKSNSEFALPYERLMILFKVSHRINQIGDVQKLLNEILHSAVGDVGAERGLIIITDDSGKTYRTVASEPLQEEDITFSTSIVQATLNSKKTLLSADLRTDKRFKDVKSAKALRILSFVCVPLIVPGKTEPIGTLYVDQRIAKKIFTREDAAYLEAFANLAAIAINNATLMEQLIGENIQLRQEIGKKYEFPGVIGQSKAMQKVYREMNQILNDDCTVLITGESGAGKEVIARALHYSSNRKGEPFLAINCGALPETLLEAELFGSVKGAFTGAVDKQGLFQAADNGTLFLDEIHHTSETMQIKLLRVLQDREIRRVGGTKMTKINVRLICATNEDLQRAVQDRRFRRDFFYRINVVTLDIPPLRERREDIPSLTHHFLKKYTEKKAKSIRGFSKRALDALANYDWVENNVRELENEIERAIIFTREGTQITVRGLSEKVRMGTTRGIADVLTDEDGQPLSYDEFEKRYIQYILSSVDGNQTKAAQIMGIPRTTLRGKMKKCGLSK